MKLIGKLALWAWAPHSATGYWISSQTDSSYWRSHFLYSSAQHGRPQDSVLSLLLFTLYTHNCKFADDTTIIRRITNNDETSYLD